MSEPIHGVVDHIENGLAVLDLIDTDGQPVHVHCTAGDLQERDRVVLTVEKAKQ